MSMKENEHPCLGQDKNEISSHKFQKEENWMELFLRTKDLAILLELEQLQIE